MLRSGCMILMVLMSVFLKFLIALQCSTITVGSKNAVIELTETSSILSRHLLDEATVLRQEARTAEEGGDTDTAATKNTAAEAKETEAQNLTERTLILIR